MPDDGTRGPPVDGQEDLYRLITTKDWWQNDRPSSAAFKLPKFSTNVVSLTTLEKTVEQLIKLLNKPKGGVVQFNCGIARGFGFDARMELDQNFPENTAHANVYHDGSGSRRKTDAKKLAESCRCVHEPTFD